MSGKRLFLIVMFAAVTLALARVASAELREGAFLEYGKYASASEDVAWHATFGLDFNIASFGDFGLDAVGRIQTVSRHDSAFVDITNAGLSEISYRLEPRLTHKKDYYIAMRHWSLHRADAFGTVPNVNFAALGVTKSFGGVRIDASIQHMIGVNDGVYRKLLVIEGYADFLHMGRYTWYGGGTLEAIPGAQGKIETGISAATRKGFLKKVDVFAAYHFCSDGFSAMYGRAKDGLMLGFRLGF